MTTLTFDSITLPSSQNWSHAAFGNGVYVVVAESTTVALTSTDGETWVTRTMPSSGFYRVAYGNDRFVAIGPNGYAYSVDGGSTWTPVSTPAFYSGQTVNALAFGGGVFASVSWGGVAATSPDGVVWTERSCPSRVFYDMTYGNGLFVAVGTTNSGGIAVSAVSGDGGATWTEHVDGFATDGRYEVAFGNNLFVGIDGNGSFSWSDNGQLWNRVPTPGFFGGTGSAIAFWVDKFVSTTQGSRSAATSPDGVVWDITPDVLPASSYNYWGTLAVGGGADPLIAVASFENIAGVAAFEVIPTAAFWTQRIRTQEII